jgi:hypothetical protein
MAIGPRKVVPRGARPVIDDAVVQALLPANREVEPEDRALALTHAPLWRSARLSSDQVRAWLRVGAHPEEAHLVAALLMEGITSDRGEDVVTHPDTGERMAVLELARREHDPRQPRALQEALDDAGVERDSRPFRWWAVAGG